MASLAEGIAQGLLQMKMLKRQDAERAVRDDYMKSQKKILDAQIKAQEAEENYWRSLPENMRKLRYMPKEMQMLGFISMGMEPPPSLPGGTPKGQFPINLPPSTSMTPVPGASGPGGAPAPTWGGGVLDMIGELLSRGALLKATGIDPGKTTWRTVRGEGGGPVSQRFNDYSGLPVGRGVPEPTEFKTFERTLPSGETEMVPYNPYSPQSFMQRGAGVKTGPSVFEKPLPLNQIENLRHVETGEKAPPGITLGQAIEQGYLPLSPAQEKTITSAKSAMEAMDEIERLVDKLDLADNPTERLWKAPALYAAAYSQINSDAAVFLRMTEAMIPKFARAQGEVGNLAESEQKRAYASIPKLGDTKDVARGKLKVLREILVGTAERSSGVAVRGVSGMTKPPKLGGKNLVYDPESGEFVSQ